MYLKFSEPWNVYVKWFQAYCFDNSFKILGPRPGSLVVLAQAQSPVKALPRPKGHNLPSDQEDAGPESPDPEPSDPEYVPPPTPGSSEAFAVFADAASESDDDSCVSYFVSEPEVPDSWHSPEDLDEEEHERYRLILKSSAE